MLDTLIGHFAQRVQKMTPEEMVARYRFADPVGPGLAEWLLRVGWQTVDASDPAYVATRLLEGTLNRALEIVSEEVTECDGDHCYPLEEPYRFRVRSFGVTLAGFATAPDPLVLLDGIEPVLVAGIPWEGIVSGARSAPIMAAWRSIVQAITDLHPNAVKTEQVRIQRMAARR